MKGAYLLPINRAQSTHAYPLAGASVCAVADHHTVEQRERKVLAAILNIKALWQQLYGVEPEGFVEPCLLYKPN